MPNIDDDYDNRAYHEPDYFTDPEFRREINEIIRPQDLFDEVDEISDEYDWDTE